MPTVLSFAIAGAVLSSFTVSVFAQPQCAADPALRGGTVSRAHQLRSTHSRLSARASDASCEPEESGNRLEELSAAMKYWQQNMDLQGWHVTVEIVASSRLADGTLGHIDT